LKNTGSYRGIASSDAATATESMMPLGAEVTGPSFSANYKAAFILMP
jgi:hypothetical protein